MCAYCSTWNIPFKMPAPTAPANVARYLVSSNSSNSTPRELFTRQAMLLSSITARCTNWNSPWFHSFTTPYITPTRAIDQHATMNERSDVQSYIVGEPLAGTLKPAGTPKTAGPRKQQRAHRPTHPPPSPRRAPPAPQQHHPP